MYSPYAIIIQLKNTTILKKLTMVLYIYTGY